jgi:hypothetical protein
LKDFFDTESIKWIGPTRDNGELRAFADLPFERQLDVGVYPPQHPPMMAGRIGDSSCLISGIVIGYGPAETTIDVIENLLARRIQLNHVRLERR